MEFHSFALGNAFVYVARSLAQHDVCTSSSVKEWKHNFHYTETLMDNNY